jgi:hypothetical protein
MKKALFILTVFFIASCSSTKNSGQTKAPATKSSSRSSGANKLNAVDTLLVGHWKYAAFEILQMPGYLPEKQKESIVMRMKNSSSVEFHSDKSLKIVVVDSIETGTWQSINDKMVYLYKPSGTDTFNINNLSKDAIDGVVNSATGASLKVGLARLP